MATATEHQPALDAAGARSAEDAFRAERHAYHRLRVSRVVRETADASSFALSVPPEQRASFAYQAGQFLTFRVEVDGKTLTRCYSLSSSPDVDPEPVVTVKRVADGRVSNWFNDHVQAGSELEVLPPSGHFVLHERGGPVVGFAGGSGITPIFSLLKTALLRTSRQCLLVYANRDERSVIFGAALESLLSAHPGRLRVIHSLDDRDGFLTAARVHATLAELSVPREACDYYVCGPGAFMDVVELVLRDVGVPRSHVFVERFVSPPDPDEARALAQAAQEQALAEPAANLPTQLVVRWDGQVHLVPYQPGDSILRAAIRAGIDPPYSCEEAYCSSCQALLRKGTVRQAMNDCLSAQELADGLILACQAYPTSAEIEVDWDA